MMDKKMIDTLSEYFNEEKQFIEDGYYRLRKKTEVTYDLAYLVPSSCGTMNIHPQITLSVQGDQLIATSLMDFETTPTKHIQRTTETEQLLDLELEKLVGRFLQAKKLVV